MGGDPWRTGWRKDSWKKYLIGGLSTHSGGRSKTAENGGGKENGLSLAAMAYKARPRLALADLPTESVDNPVRETW